MLMLGRLEDAAASVEELCGRIEGLAIPTAIFLG
jgi:hypothetical protein